MLVFEVEGNLDMVIVIRKLQEFLLHLHGWTVMYDYESSI